MEGGWWARGMYQRRRDRCGETARTTDHSTAKSVVNLAHRAVQREELSTGLATFLEFTLKTAEDVVKGETTLAWWAHAATHAAHANEPLRLHRRATLAANVGGSLTTKVEGVTRAGGGGHVLVVA